MSDNLVIPQDWTFKNRQVAENFDAHVREQLPFYDLATGVVAHLGRHYLPEKGTLYDLGASTGNITKMLEREITHRKAKAVSIDYSEEMQDIWQGVGEFILGDVTTFDYEQYDFAVCFLILMFIPVSKRKNFLITLLSKRKKGGALILFDKVADYNGYLGTVMHRLTLAGKVSTGVSSDNIVKKELSLAGYQRPVTIKELELESLGAVEIFRFGEFVGWIFTD